MSRYRNSSLSLVSQYDTKDNVMPLIPTISIIIQRWEESEAGWGVRPDGYTIHLTREDRDKFVDRFWKDQKERLGEATPPEYTRVAGEPQEAKIIKNGTFHRKLLKEKDKHGIWGHPSSWPGADLLLKDPVETSEEIQEAHDEAFSQPFPRMDGTFYALVEFILSDEETYEWEGALAGLTAIVENMSIDWDLGGEPSEPYKLIMQAEEDSKHPLRLNDLSKVLSYLDSLDCTVQKVIFTNKAIS